MVKTGNCTKVIPILYKIIGRTVQLLVLPFLIYCQLPQLDADTQTFYAVGMDNQPPVPVGTPISSTPPPQPIAQIFQPQDVHANVNVSVVPRENGWVQTAPVDPATLGSTDVVPPVVMPAPQPTAPLPIEPVVQPPSVPQPESPAVPPPQAEEKPSAADEGKPAKGDEDKSPLEILEEILANAGEEKAEQEKEAAAKKAAADQEKAAMAAKEAQFKEEAAQKIAAIAPELQAAQQQRDNIDAQHPEAKSDQLTPDLTINQLRHETTLKSE